MVINNEQFDELKKCESSILYFANKYIKISDNNSVRQISLNDFQKGVIEKFETSKCFFLLGERMDGKTTVAAIILLHCALFQSKSSNVIFAPKQVMSDYMIELITEMYERLPNFLNITSIKLKSKQKLEFDNGSSILSAGAHAQSLLSVNISNMYIDESEFIKDDMNKIITKLAVQLTSKPSSKMFILSSAKTNDNLDKSN